MLSSREGEGGGGGNRLDSSIRRIPSNNRINLRHTSEQACESIPPTTSIHLDSRVTSAGLQIGFQHSETDGKKKTELFRASLRWRSARHFGSSRRKGFMPDRNILPARMTNKYSHKVASKTKARNSFVSCCCSCNSLAQVLVERGGVIFFSNGPKLANDRRAAVASPNLATCHVSRSVISELQ